MSMRRADLPMPCRLELLRSILVALTVVVNYSALAKPEVYFEHCILSVANAKCTQSALQCGDNINFNQRSINQDVIVHVHLHLECIKPSTGHTILDATVSVYCWLNAQ
jgi:hypothetical protein